MESSAQPISTGPLEAATSIYNNNFTYIFVKFLVLTIVHVLILIWALLGTGLADLVNNWPKYRCNPLIMPFAGLFGYDSAENFNYCMKSIFSSNAGAVLTPVYGVMSSFTDIVGTISNVANSFRYLIANLLHGMERLMGSFRDRFQFILFSIRISFLKMMTLMGRIHGTFQSVIFMGLSGIQAVNNVANNDLIKFMTEFCFNPDTLIELLDGKTKPICELKIGDKLRLVNGVSPTVTSLFKFDGKKTQMVNIKGVKVSSKHYIHYDTLDSWIESGDHPDATFSESVDEIFCLNTDTHTISINGLLFSDYDESTDYTVMNKTKRFSEALLNNKRENSDVGKEGNNYELGFSENALIYLENGRIIPITKISLGDVLINGGIVHGIVTEMVTSVVKIGSLYVSPAQLFWDAVTNRWVRAGALYKTFTRQLEEPTIFYQLIVSNNIINANGFYFRDYREISDTQMESEYANKMASL